MRYGKLMVAAAFGCLVAVAAPAQQTAAPAAPIPAPAERAIVALGAPGLATLRVTTPAFADGGDIPFANTQYEGNVFPGLDWSAGPAATRSYAVIMQDIDGRRNERPYIVLHWTMYNVPAAVVSLPAGMAPDARPAGAVYGLNVRGQQQPYMGPRTPPGPKHRYYLQVFALDTVLPVRDELSYDQLIDSMRGHVLASGEVMGLGRAPDGQ